MRTHTRHPSFKPPDQKPAPSLASAPRSVKPSTCTSPSRQDSQSHAKHHHTPIVLKSNLAKTTTAQQAATTNLTRTRANPDLKIASLIAGMVCGADCIDDMDMIRHGGMGELFDDWRAPSTLGSFLRAFSFGHARQVDAVACRFLAGLDRCSGVFGPANVQGPIMVDIDDTVIPVFSANKQGARVGYTNIRGLDVLLMSVCGPWFPPVIINQRLRKGSAHSSRGATRLIRDGLSVLRRSSLGGRQVWLRADSGFYSHQIAELIENQQGWVSLTIKTSQPVRAAIATIKDDAWTNIKYPQAMWDEDTHTWVSQAQIAETSFVAFGSTKHRLPARLVIRRIPDYQVDRKITAGQDPLFACWRYHAFITTVPSEAFNTVDVDRIHRQHAVIEQVNSSLKNCALAHLPSASFAANMVWLTCATMAFNLARGLASLTGDDQLTMATPMMICRRLIQIPARISHSGRQVIMHLPDNWRWATQWLTLFNITNRVST